jgi:hypothetical protein
VYRCNNCGGKFEEPTEKRICFEQEYGVANLFESRNYTNIHVCPCCGDNDIHELEQCAVCGEWFDELEDTVGLVNGGIGYVCEQCYKDCEIGGIYE